MKDGFCEYPPMKTITMQIWLITRKARLKSGERIPGTSLGHFMFEAAGNPTQAEVETWAREKFGEDFISAEYKWTENVEA